MKTYCAGCGEDCSHAYGTWNGDAYHFGCIPVRSKRRAQEAEEDAAIAKQRITEITTDPDRLVQGQELQSRLDTIEKGKRSC